MRLSNKRSWRRNRWLDIETTNHQNKTNNRGNFCSTKIEMNVCDVVWSRRQLPADDKKSYPRAIISYASTEQVRAYARSVPFSLHPPLLFNPLALVSRLLADRSRSAVNRWIRRLLSNVNNADEVSIQRLRFPCVCVCVHWKSEFSFNLLVYHFSRIMIASAAMPSLKIMRIGCLWSLFIWTFGFGKLAIKWM